MGRGPGCAADAERGASARQIDANLQSFIESQLEKISTLRGWIDAAKLDIALEVDGGVKKGTIERAAEGLNLQSNKGQRGPTRWSLPKSDAEIDEGAT